MLFVVIYPVMAIHIRILSWALIFILNRLCVSFLHAKQRTVETLLRVTAIMRISPLRSHKDLPNILFVYEVYWRDISITGMIPKWCINQASHTQMSKNGDTISELISQGWKLVQVRLFFCATQTIYGVMNFSWHGVEVLYCWHKSVFTGEVI